MCNKNIFIVLIFFIFVSATVFSQTVSNIRFEQKNEKAEVFYDLVGQDSYLVSISYSQDQGYTWSAPLIEVSGDVGNSQMAGANKLIIWDVLRESNGIIGSVIFKVEAVQPTHIKMIFVKGDIYRMGSAEIGGDALPTHGVKLNDFYISKNEVNQALWYAIMGKYPSHFRNITFPVESVSWEEVQVFINKLNAITNKKYRLPTEAEWEYAANGGSYSRSYIYSGSDDVNAVAWYYDNSKGKTHEVSQKKVNELGICDMSGNVAEFCADYYQSDFYKTSTFSNPVCVCSEDDQVVVRGGSWGSVSSYCCVENRAKINKNKAYYRTGFRLVLSENSQSIRMNQPVESLQKTP